MKLSKHQINVLHTLYDGGIITQVDDGIVFLHDSDYNDLAFKKSTFKKLLYHELIVFSYAPAMGVECFGNTNKANEFLKLYFKNQPP